MLKLSGMFPWHHLLPHCDGSTLVELMCISAVRSNVTTREFVNATPKTIQLSVIPRHLWIMYIQREGMDLYGFLRFGVVNNITST